MFGLFKSRATKDRAEAKQTCEMVLQVIFRIKFADLRPTSHKVSAASVIAESFLRELDRVIDEACARLPAHCSETPLSLSSPDYLRAEAKKAFQAADKVADQVGFQPFTISGTNNLLGAYILCHAWGKSDQMTADDQLNCNFSLDMWKSKLPEEIEEFLVGAGVKEDVASWATKMR